MKSSSSNKKKNPSKKETAEAKITAPAVLSENLFPVVGIGASAGGLDAFRKLLKAIPEDSGMAFVLVQHLDPNHESLLPEILQKVARIPVMEITDDIKVKPDHVYVIPSNKIMVASDGILKLAPRPGKSKTERHLPIDLFFTSLAEVHLEHAIGVVLSGTASDGTQGLRAIKENGGITFAQDEASAEYESMPHNAAEAGVVDFILPPGDIPAKLLEVTSKAVRSDEELQNIPQQDEDVFRQILSLLRIRKGVDFTYYKQTTIRRRILRRMVVNKNEEPAEYLKFLRNNNPEQDLLFQDLLIPVTSFFRDKKTFENLCKEVFPVIIKNKVPGEVIRIWVTGCSTGQEAYSFAICFKEFLGDQQEKIQIFGTDLSEPAILKARTGIYEKGEMDAVSPQRLQDFFTKTNGSYQVNKSIRDMCVFAHHNFLKDPPFGKMDVISCRNVLIYMEPHLQKKALTTFHYALNPNGFLLLGKSETTGSVPDLFTAAAKSDKLYTRKDVAARYMQIASHRSEQIISHASESSKSESTRTNFQKTADDILLTRYTPPGVVVNDTMDIVHFRGNTRNYLEQAPGKPSHNLLMMAKNGLAFELRNILHKTKTSKAPVVKENIPLNVNDTIRIISIEAMPLPNTLEPYYLVLFHDNTTSDLDGTVVPRKKVSAKTKKDEKEIRIQLLEQELAQAREDMRSITEDQEAANEELQSANEELLSGSEELQSLNEELETSKEELQSTNEELTVLNHELISLNEQVTDARNYSESVVTTLYQPLLVLDRNLRVKTANKAFYKTFQVNELETEGELIYDLGNRQWNIPELRTLLEEILPQKSQVTDYEVIHRFTSIGDRVMLLNALELTRDKKEEKLILLSIEDITERKEIEKILITNTIRFRQLVKDLPAAVYSCDAEGEIIFYNDQAVRLWGRHPIPGKHLWSGANKMFSPDELELALENTPMATALKEGLPVISEEITLERYDGSKAYVLANAQPDFDLSGKVIGCTNMLIDITEQVLARRKMEDSDKRYNMMLMNSPFTFAVLKGKNKVIALANARVKAVWGKGNDVEGKSLLEIMPELNDTPFPALLDEVMATGIPYHGTEVQGPQNIHGHAREEYFNFVFQPYWEADETISGITIIGYDVTEQVIAKRKIEESENRFRLALSGTSQIVFSQDTALRHTWIYNSLPDFTPEGIIGKTDDELHIPKSAEILTTIKRKVLETGETFNGDVELEVSGKPLFYEMRVEAIRNDGGMITGIIGVASDITERKQAADKTKESEEQFSTLAENMENLAWLADGEGHIYWYNKRWYDYTGSTQEEMEGWGWRKVHHPDHVDRVVDFVKEAWDKNKPFELTFPLRGADGEYKWFLTRAYPMADDQGKVIRWIGTNTNIDEQKKAEEAIKYSQALLEAHNEGSIDGILLVDTRGKILSYNHKFIEIWSMPKAIVDAKDDEAALQFAMDQLVNPEQFIEKVKWLYEHPTETSADELEFTDGKIVERHGYPVVGEDGSYYAWSWTFRDITESKRAEMILRQSEENFRQLADLMPAKVSNSDLDGKVIYLNKNWLDFTGMDFEELRDEGYYNILHPDEIEEFKKRFTKASETGTVLEMEMRFRNKNGDYVWHLNLASPVKDENGSIKRWVGVTTEIQRIKEEEKRKGDFIKMVSHELKTPVTSIKGYVQLLLAMLETEQQLKTSLPLTSSLARIDSQVSRLTRLITEMLDLSRIEAGKLDLKNDTFSLNDLVSETVEDLLQSSAKHPINLSQDFQCNVCGDRDRIGQVLINLINNAVKYSPENSKIEIHVKAGDTNQALVSVKDNGIGIDEKDQKKIFERFYRVEGIMEQSYAGFGIGLFIANEIIQRHEGSINVESEKGRGSVFSFTLPLAPVDKS